MTIIKNFMENITGIKIINITSTELISFISLLGEAASKSLFDLEESLLSSKNDAVDRKKIGDNLKAHREIQDLLITLNKHVTNDWFRKGILNNQALSQIKISLVVKTYLCNILDVTIRKVINKQQNAIKRKDKENLSNYNNRIDGLIQLQLILNN